MSQEKKELLYGATLSLIAESHHLGSIKVADIAAKANMGKSTVYEYFDSKEQLIAESLIFMFKKGIEAFEKIVSEDRSFKETFFILLDNLADCMDKNKRMLDYMTMNEYNFAIHQTVKSIMLEKFEEIRLTYFKAVEKLVDKSIKEGIVKVKPEKFDWYMAVVNSMTYMFIHKQNFPEFNHLTDEEVKEKAYSAFLTILNNNF
ncbi:TetR/AcrR family transcriptional regulator [Anaerobranca gottschalkii]|uniref:Transcriptional regulator, TetR family n=1 Tax=Anaerobranca gottschalkii DSM 13577 TaxID=1120990 RepID=A0A1I0AM54_9FIRM|nr:TetR/AcrR family transcriptional regulator [Anaerobranca gottschalkii]SES95466.1 transcriptional regulator, TetR family [Anaerobranca gottschalkii DSM 13577]